MTAFISDLHRGQRWSTYIKVDFKRRYDTPLGGSRVTLWTYLQSLNKAW